MGQFEEAVRMLNDQFPKIRQMMYGIGTSVMKKNELKESVLKLEERSIGFKKTMEEFSKRKEVLSNKDELAFIVIFSKGYLSKYYIIRGMATEFREGNLIDQAEFKDVMENIITYTQVFPDIIGQVFQHTI